MTETQQTAMRAAHNALELAQENLRGHGDNCFLHDDGEYNRCFCGLDSVKSHLMTVTEEIAAALAEPERPVAEYRGWYCAHCECGVDSSDVTFHEQHTVCGRVITDDRPPPPQEPAANMWESFAAYLIDKCEGEVISEESMQRSLADMLSDPAYTAPQAQPPAPPADVPMLTDDEIDSCEEVARKSFHRSQRQVRGQMFSASDSPDWHRAKAVEQAVRQKAGLA